MSRISIAFLAAFAMLMLGSAAVSGAFSPSEEEPQMMESIASNWAGYVINANPSGLHNGSVTAVSGSWIVPKLNCSKSLDSYSVFWVGIDGYSSKTVEQAGTSAHCLLGRPMYYAWYEAYPNSPERVNMRISPGDNISAEVRYIGNGMFRLTLNDTTTGKGFSTIERSEKAERSSAEWIAEAPFYSDGVLPLADFGEVYFTNAKAEINGVTGSIKTISPVYEQITMYTSENILGMQPANLSEDGSSFQILWQHQ